MSLRFPAHESTRDRAKAVEDHAFGFLVRSVKVSVTRQSTAPLSRKGACQPGSKRRREALKQVALPGIFRNLIFGAPWDRENKRRRGSSIASGVPFSGSLAQTRKPVASRATALWRREFTSHVSGVRCSPAWRRARSPRGGRTGFGRECGCHGAPGAWQVLYETASQMHIQDLASRGKSRAAEGREVALRR